MTHPAIARLWHHSLPAALLPPCPAADVWRGLCGCLQQSLLVRDEATREEFPTYVQQCGTVLLQGAATIKLLQPR